MDYDEQPSAADSFRAGVQQKFQVFLDRSTVTYGLGIFLLNNFIGFLSPQVDPESDGPLLPVSGDGDFKPSAGALPAPAGALALADAATQVPEFKFWYSSTKGVVVAFFMTFFSIPVFWPILLIYFFALFFLTMKRQIKHMIKHNAMGKGEESLFGKKLSKEDAKKEKEAKKAEAKAKRDEEGGEGRRQGRSLPKKKKKDAAAEPKDGAPKADESEADRLAREEHIIATFAHQKASHAHARDINVRDVTISFHGANLIENTDFSLNYGNRYGFIGPNGSGKSTIMKAIAAAVFEVDDERKQLEAEAERVNDAIGACDDEDEQTALSERLNGLRRLELGGDGRGPRPTCLVLDEPTNHLDMDAVFWLEDYLASWTKILLFVSHSQDFMNGVCTHLIRLNEHTKKLDYYSGNYDQYVAERKVRDDEQQRKYDAEQRDIAEIKDFIARFGHGTVKMVRQAQSREKLLAKKLEEGLTAKPSRDAEWDFSFPDPGELPTPVLMIQDVSFAYPGCEPLYHNLDLGIDLESRALVGPNGAGKTTFVKLMTGELQPTAGAVRPHSHLRMAKFTQHFGRVRPRPRR
ncbi:ATPase [Aureococcus anophagefferens]|nr:ATPase [Aureococcus anophagefferens]